MDDMRENQLTHFSRARAELAKATSVDEVKDIRDKAEAMRAYARKAGDLEFAWWATELKLDAERREVIPIPRSCRSPRNINRIIKWTL